jgi:hypothetical protein
MIGSTFGIAVIGAIVATVGKSELEQSLPHVPESVRTKIANGLGSGGAPTGHTSAHVVAAVQDAFVSALRTGLSICAAVTLLAAVAAWVLIEKKVTVPSAATTTGRIDDRADDRLPAEVQA